MEIETQRRTPSPRILSVLLHAHMPYGIRSDLDRSLEQAWLFEAVTGCYLPLLKLIRRLDARDEGAWLTLSLSPTLLELWAHPDFGRRYRKHLDAGLKIMDSEAAHPKHPLPRRQLAVEIRKNWESAKLLFDEIDGQLCKALVHEAKANKIELITTSASHAFLPAFQNNTAFRRFQIENGLSTFTRHTGLRTKGFWLPECAYFPGLEEDLKEFNLDYFALEELGFNAAVPPASIRAPIKCPKGLIAIGRDAKLSQKVWSAHSGYPGNPDYREFHHDGIRSIEPKLSGDYMLPGDEYLPFGLKYWRVTGSPHKDWYDPEAALRQTQKDANDFTQQITQIGKGLIFLPFDAELFGHWWYEGPVWLERVLKSTAELRETKVLAAETAVGEFDRLQSTRPAASTWGRKSDYSFWINRDTDWVYPLIKTASEQYARTVANHRELISGSLEHQALCQAGRELLLASASDWPFMIRAGTTVDYAVQRMRDHLGRLHFLLQSIQNKSINPRNLKLLEELNPAFHELSINSYLASPKSFTHPSA